MKIICVGKIKEQFYKEAINEYLKRLTKYVKLDIVEVSDYNIEVNLLKEKEAIMKNINDKDFVVTLEIEGEALSSKELAIKLNDLVMKNSNIVFIIGGSNGIHLDIKKRSNYSLSFSKLTFPHQLFRVILLEQLYRAYKINNNESYHK